MSWVCSEFGATPREALLTLEYDPDDMPWNLLSRIGEVRQFTAVHREFTRIFEGSVGDSGPAMQRLEKQALWQDYEKAVSDRAHGRG